MIELMPLYIIFLTVGFLIMLLSFFIMKFRLGLIVMTVGAVIAFSGILLFPHPALDFCEDNNGIYNQANGMSLCSIPDSDGEYVVYKVIKVDDEFKLARFSELRNIKGEQYE